MIKSSKDYRIRKKLEQSILPTMSTTTQHIILASSSPYRKKQLESLGILFTCESPSIDETPNPNESAKTLSLRLAIEKARIISNEHKSAVVIGSDQVALCEDKIIEKPGSEKKARRQLTQLQGKTAIFFTSVAICQGLAKPRAKCIISRVLFRALTKTQISNYVKLDQPSNCTGSFKSESLGICLFQYIKSNDPTALVGLPMIALTSLLAEKNINLI